MHGIGSVNLFLSQTFSSLYKFDLQAKYSDICFLLGHHRRTVVPQFWFMAWEKEKSSLPKQMSKKIMQYLLCDMVFHLGRSHFSTFMLFTENVDGLKIKEFLELPKKT